VGDVIMPVVGKIFGGLDFSNYFIPLSGQTATTLLEAKKAGAVFAYGSFLTVLVNFIILAFIFVFLQILGGFFGFHWGFAGYQSEAAFNAVGAGRYASYADVREHYKRIADTAQSKLEQLQQRMMARNGDSGNDGFHTTKNFYDFMEAERTREALERQQELTRTAQRGHMESASAALIATPSPAPMQTQQATRIGVAPQVPALEELMQTVQGFGSDKDAKKAFIQRLSPAQQADIMTALKAKKAEEERLTHQRDAELDRLL
jgi:hypothetical protein